MIYCFGFGLLFINILVYCFGFIWFWFIVWLLVYCLVYCLASCEWNSQHIVLRFIHVVACIHSFLLFICNIHMLLYEHTTVCLFTYLLVDIWIVSSFTTNIHVQLFVWTRMFISFGYKPQSEISGS